ncbi:MAG: DUF4831 family protein [Paludibacteraceae bacterium]|nr:DUF4831 family protein [Paludibacteraceae bacterium]
MKKIFIAAICCLMVLTAQAGEKKFKIYYNEVEHIRGELYQYSERYLGTTDVVTEDGITYELDRVSQVIPKPANTKTTDNTKGTQTQPEKERTVRTQPLPLNEEALLATNMAKKAESVAKQIYRIRETRMNILAGDVEHMPADGKSMELVLNELKKQEKALTGMFVGKTIIRPKTKVIIIDVDDNVPAIQQVLCKFSEQEGPVDTTHNSGKPVVVNISRYTHSVLADEQPKKKNAEPVYKDEVFRSVTRITYNNKTIYEKTFSL